MSRAAWSLLVFGIYLLLLGASLIVAPNPVLRLFGVARTHEVWIRILGVILTYVGTYYLVAARNGLTAIFRASVPVRLSLVVFLTMFALLDYAKPVVILFGVVDAAAALWTLAALRVDAAAG